jgi:methylated-DNA-[protein]-cysteine S-methyltransferase
MQTRSPLYSTTHPTPVGLLTLIASDHGLRAILWPRESPRRAGIANRPRRDPEHPLLKQTATQLDEYFAGARTSFDVPLDLEGTRFQVAAWRALASIPFGGTTTYGRQAAALGIPTAARALGAANRANPVCIVLPCHRVIGADGSLTGFAGGLATKQWLLDHEAQVLTSPSPLWGGSGRGSERSIVSTPEWQKRQPVQTRLSMPVG